MALTAAPKAGLLVSVVAREDEAAAVADMMLEGFKNNRLVEVVVVVVVVDNACHNMKFKNQSLMTNQIHKIESTAPCCICKTEE